MTREEAINTVRNIYHTDEEREALQTLIPELTETEDERIRKGLIKFLNQPEISNRITFEAKQMWIAYLEKQKEQKPVEWKPQSESLEALMYAIEGKWEKIRPTSYLSRRLEDLYDGLVNTFNVDESLLDELPNVAATEDIEELRELKRKIDASMEQKPVEWSEEDEKRIQRIRDFLWKNRKGDTDTIYQIEKDADWLKSLHPSWKPSEEQMEALM